jgi:hypothetical protein
MVRPRQRTPFSSLERVSASHGTPDAAFGVVCLLPLELGLFGAYSVVTSISVVTFYISYLIPIYLGTRIPGWQKDAVWSLNKYSRPVGYLGLLWGFFIFVVLILPPNELAGKTLAALMFILAVLYFARARHQYEGPAWARTYLDNMKSGQTEKVASGRNFI